MPLSAGDRLGPYEIRAPIGAGGMGEVYRARDTKLKRDVALKVLPESFASDPDRMARFQREAEVLASLNHPNIAAIYGVEERALAMELVEGETLPCPVPLDTALNYARQIADALEYAHERGVIHRDLKPANVKVTTEGMVKLLDFGLAKAIEDPVSAPDNSANSPTLTLGHTQVGVILGTAAYMAPEQAAGGKVDRRADIWSFGAVLFEMLAGKRAFEGDSVADTLATVMKVEPDWGALPRDTPAAIRNLIQRCLTKDRKQRLQAIGEARIVLEHLGKGMEAPQPAKAYSNNGAWPAAAVVFLALFASVSLIHFREQLPPGRTLRYTIPSPENTSQVHSFAISPNGRFVAIAAQVNGKRQLWLRALDSFQTQAMAFTEDATYPFWSPDSRYIGFFAKAMLKKIAANGGPAQSLCDVPNARGGSWNREDVIVFSPGPGLAIQRVSAGGGVPGNINPAKGRFPAFLPDGRRFLYLAGIPTPGPAEQNGIYLSSLDGSENRRILPDQSSVVSAAGHLFFIRENTLMALPFDMANAQAIGEVFPAAEDVGRTMNGEFAPIAVSETGVLLYESGAAASGNNQASWFGRDGKLLETFGTNVWEPAISPDEKAVVYRRGPVAGGSLWVRDLTRGADQRLTSEAFTDTAPLWSPGGDRIAFTSNRKGAFDLYQRPPAGGGQDEPIFTSGSFKLPTQWSRDGRFLVYTEFASGAVSGDVWVLPMNDRTERKPVRVLHAESGVIFGQLSPDSHWMAYTSDESGQREVYVRPFPAGEGQWKISIAGGEQPRWRGDGNELFFGELMER